MRRRDTPCNRSAHSNNRWAEPHPTVKAEGNRPATTRPQRVCRCGGARGSARAAGRSAGRIRAAHRARAPHAAGAGRPGEARPQDHRSPGLASRFGSVPNAQVALAPQTARSRGRRRRRREGGGRADIGGGAQQHQGRAGRNDGPRRCVLAATSGANRLPSVHGSSDKGMTTWGRGCVGILRSRRGAAVVPLLEVPSGVLADRWSRSRIMVLACVALLVSSTIGGLSQSVSTYVVAAVALGGYSRWSPGRWKATSTARLWGGTERGGPNRTGTGGAGWWSAGPFVLAPLPGGVLAEATSARTTLAFRAVVPRDAPLHRPPPPSGAAPSSPRTHAPTCRLPSRSAGSAASRACRGRAVAPEGGGVRPAGGC